MVFKTKTHFRYKGKIMKTVVITGASSGIGCQFAKECAKGEFDRLILIARRKERLLSLKKNFENLGKNTIVLDYDLTDEKCIKEYETFIKENNIVIDLLINSAGLGYNDYYLSQDINDDMKMIDLNIRALTQITRISLDYMNSPSKIINIASVAAFMPQPKFAVYAASKSYVLSFSRALNRELKDKKIRVQALCPNPVDTEFFKGRNEKSSIKNFFNEDIEKLVKKSLLNNREVVTVNFMAKFLHLVSKIFPTSFNLTIEKLLRIY